MAKLQDNVSVLLSPFQAAIGEKRFPIVCNQTASLLGNIKLDVTEGRWKVTATGKLTQGSKTKGVLPMNNPAAILYRFALGIDELTEQGVFVANCSVPKNCQAWIENIKTDVVKPEPVKA